MATERGVGSGPTGAMKVLLDFLRSRLKGLFFENEGTPPQDLAYTNLFRLRALFEETGRENILRDTKTRKGIHELVKAAGDDRLRSTVVGLFGEPGTVGANATGELRGIVDRQAELMRSEAPNVDDVPLGFGGGSAPAPDEPVSSPAPTAGATGPLDSTEAAAGRRNEAPVESATEDPVAPVTGGTGGTGGGAGGGTGAGGSAGGPGGDPQPGGPHTIPGTMELWKVENAYYLVDKIPGTNTPLVWQVENAERLEHIYGTRTPEIDRELTRAEWRGLSPWRGGMSAEIVNTDKEPWQQFMSDFDAAAEFRPWIRDEDFQAIIGVAYLEGREPTEQELAQTDWWNNHTADERAWMLDSVTLGQTEVERRHEDARRLVEQGLRDAGMANPSKAAVDYIARQRLTGKWSEAKTGEQMRKVTDPFAPGELDRGLLAALRDPDSGSAADAAAVGGTKQETMARIKTIFDNARAPIATDTESEEDRLSRIADEVRSGQRTMSDLRRSVDIIAFNTTGGVPGGGDVNREGEDRVRQLLREWVGPAVAAGYSEDWIREQAGLLRNNPDGEQELVERLQAARLASFGNWTDASLRYEDIAPVARSLFSQVWGQSVDESDPLFLDIVNQTDRHAGAQRLRQEGLKRNVGKVVDDALAGLSETAIGQQVVRSAV